MCKIALNINMLVEKCALIFFIYLFFIFYLIIYFLARGGRLGCALIGACVLIRTSTEYIIIINTSVNFNYIS